jgi:hypothetical protein
MRRLALCALLLCGCQSFGAFSQPTTLPKGAARLSTVIAYDRYQVSGERLRAGDVGLAVGLGLSDRTEFDALYTAGVTEAQLKQALIRRPHVALAVKGGLGFFSNYRAGTSAFYLPASLVGGVRPSDEVSLFAGPQAWGAVGLSDETFGAGFHHSRFGLLVGGVAGFALESPRFTFVPQVNVMTPVGSGASGTVVQFVFGIGTRVDRYRDSPSK